MKKIASVLTLVAGVTLATAAAAQITISNGISGDGAWSVEVGNGGEGITGTIDPTGAAGPTQVIYEYIFYVDPGANGGGVALGSTTTTAVHSTGSNSTQSAGSFQGPNGTINWTADGAIAPGSPVYQTTFTFTSSNPFGTVRVIGYLDEDVTTTNDLLVVVGTPGSSGFQLLTVANNANVGVAQTAGFLTATNATYTGWAARPFAELRSAITGAGATYTVAGVVTNLASTTDARYPSTPVYGPDDITSAFAFDLAPTATTATVVFALGGSPSGQALPTPTPTGVVGVATPTPTSTPISGPTTNHTIPALDRRGLFLLTVVLAALGILLTRRLIK